MSEYFIPLRTLVPLTLLAKVPVIREIAQRLGLQDLAESWNETASITEGTGVVDGEVAVDLGGFQLVIGQAGGMTAFQFIAAAERRSVLRTIIEEGIDGLVEIDPAEEPDPPIQVLLQLDSFPETFRVTISGTALKLRLPLEHAKLAKEIQRDGVPALTKVLDADGRELPVDIEIGDLVVSFDTADGLRVSVPEDQVFHVPPFFIADSELGIVASQVKIDLSATRGIAEVIARPGYAETWKGIYIGELSLFGLNTLLPFLPASIVAKSWICGNEGWSGALDVKELPTEPGDAWRSVSLGIEFDRGALVRGTVGATFQLGSLDAKLAPAGDLELRFSLRHNPALTGVAAWGFDVSVLTPGSAEAGLLTIGEEILSQINPPLPAIILLALALAKAEPSTFAVVLLDILAVLQVKQVIRLDRLRLDTLRFRSFAAPVGGEIIRFLDIVMDLQAKVSLDFNLGPVLTAKTERPIGIDLKELTLRWALNWSSFDKATRDMLEKDQHVGRFQIRFEPEGGISFDLSEQSLVQNGFIEFFRFGAGQWERGVWFDVGARTTKRISSAGAGGGAVRLFFFSNGDFSHADLKGIALTVYVPRVIYCYADLGWADVKSVYTDAFLIAKPGAVLGPPPDPAKNPMGFVKPRRSDWYWVMETLIQWQTINADDPQHKLTSVVAGIDLSYQPGIPLGTSGVAVFGVLGQYASNAAPQPKALADGSEDPKQDINGKWLPWFRDTAKRNSVLGPFPKWMPAKGDWGFGLGAVIGSVPRGSIWNAKVGLTFLLPGPVVILYGAANFLEAKPTIGSDTGGALVALIVIDFEEETLTLGVTATFELPAGGQIIRVSIPAETYVDFKEDDGKFHLYLGKHWPLSDRALAKVLGTFEVSSYLMFDTNDIKNLAGKEGLDIRGLAVAFGGRGEWTWGLESKRIKCFFRVGLEFNVAFSVPEPWYVAGAIQIDGALVVKVFGFGFQFMVWAELHGWAPKPYRIEGSVGISIDLPWPLKDIKKQLPITLVNSGAPPEVPETVIGSLTVHPQNANDPFEPQPPGAQTVPRRVPIDAIFSISFPYTMRSGPGPIGSLGSVLEPDLDTKSFTSEPDGFAFTLVDLTLTNLSTGVMKTEIPARWRKEAKRAAGQQEQRVVLDLFAFKSDPTSRYIGTSATYLDETLKSWSPCKAAEEVVAICYDFSAEPLGGIGIRTLDRAGHPSIKVTTAPPPDDVELLVSTFQVVGTTAEIVDHPGGRMARIPGTFGPWTELVPNLEVSESLVFELERARDLSVHCVQPLLRAAQPIVRFYDGEVLVHTTTAGQALSTDPPQLAYEYAGPATRIAVTCHHASLTVIGGVRSASPFPHDVFVRRICAVYEAEIEASQAAAASTTEWSKFWSDLLDHQAATSDALLLDPDSDYRLTVTVKGEPLNGSGAPATRTRTYDFHTEGSDRPLRPLRTPNEQLEEGEAPWEVESFPDDGSFAIYPNRPLRLTFSDPRVEAVFAKLAQKLVLRLLDDRGVDLFRKIEDLALVAKTLPEHEQAWKARVTGAPCSPEGVESLWSAGQAEFDLLEPKREYYAALHVVPLDVTDLASAVWAEYPILHSFKFRTSRWASLAPHTEAYSSSLRDEILDAPPDLATITAHAGAVEGAITNDQLLDTILFDDLKLPLRKPPESPETVLIWQQGEQAYSLAGVLLDGPEPLIRGEGIAIALETPHLRVSGSSGARSLLLFASPPTTPTLSITVTDTFVGKGGTPSSEAAAIAIPIATRPAILEEEHAP